MLTKNLKSTLFLLLAFLMSGFGLLFLPGQVHSEGNPHDTFTVPPSAPLQIIDLSVFPEPHIGQVVTLRIEVMSTDDEADAVILVDLPKGVELVSGETTWQGNLTANLVQVHELSVRVLNEGDWRLWISTRSKLND